MLMQFVNKYVRGKNNRLNIFFSHFYFIFLLFFIFKPKVRVNITLYVTVTYCHK